MDLNFLKKNEENRSAESHNRPNMDVSHASATTSSQPSAKNTNSGYNKVIGFILKALVFLTPVIFLPITSEIREFNKQTLIFFAVLTILAVWLIKVLTTRSASWVKTSLDYIILSYLGVYFVSSLASIDKVSSFLGYNGRFTGSFISILSLVILYFLVVNNVRNSVTLQSVTKWMTLGSFVVIVYSLLQMFGIALLPFVKDQGFNSVGSMVALAVFSALFVVFYQWQLFTQRPSKVFKVALGIFVVLALVLMFLINAFTAWLVLALGMVIFLALSMTLITQEQSNPNWFWKPFLVLVVSILFVAFQFLPQSINPRNIVHFSGLPTEVQLPTSATWSLVGNSVKSGARAAVLGSGPATTGIAFGQIKPEAFNKTIIWNLNFDRSSTEVANILIETGILGFVTFEVTGVLFLIYGLFFLLRKNTHPGKTQALGFFVFWLMLYFVHFFYFFNTTFYFLYWVSLGLFMAITHWQEQESESSAFSFASRPRAALSWMFASLLILAVLLIGGFFQLAVYAAEVYYTSGLKILSQPKPDFAKAEEKFARAVNLNQYRDTYYIVYGQNLIFRASEEAAKEEPNISQIQKWIAGSISAAKKATEISPNKPSNHSALAELYTSIRPLGVEGTDEAIIKTWEAAIAKDEKNPALLIQLANAYSTAAQVIDPSIAGAGPDTDSDGLSDSKETDLGSNPNSNDTNNNGTTDGDEVKSGFNPAGTGRLSNAQISQFIKTDSKKLKLAEDTLRKAILLKDNLPDSHMALARVLEKQNKLDEARQELDESVKKFPGNTVVKFEQGRIAYNQKNVAEAEKIFLDVIKLEPQHANAHYSLGILYLQKPDNANALKEFEKVREIVGPNVDLEKIINSLKSE